MAKANDFCVGLMHEFAITAAKAGWELDDAAKLSKDENLMRLVCGVSRGTHEIKAIEHLLATIPGFNPAEFIGKNWKVIESETDHRAAALASVNFAEAGLETCLKKGEFRITGEEKLKRLKKSGKIRLGAETFLALWQEDGHKTLEWLHKEKGVTYLDFFGILLESPDGRRYVLCLYRNDVGRWGWRYLWLDYGWNGGIFSASLAS